MKLIFRELTPLAVLLLLSFTCVSQAKKDKGIGKVILLEWNGEDCDETYDPNLLQNRITNLDLKEALTYLTVNFSDNCCVKFQPKIKFKKNRLELLPYEEERSQEYCTCDCCFSISYVISGLDGVDYDVYFKGKKIKLSMDHYKTVRPSFQLYDNRKINQTNKYGFKEGLWISFYENGKEKEIQEYPESSLYNESYPIWLKEYSKSGKLSNYMRTDTSESWFEDGELKSQHIQYKSGDTTFEKSFERFENRKLKARFLERSYPVIFKSDFDPDFQTTGFITDFLYKEEYYGDGQKMYLFGKDTSYSWYESGLIKEKTFHGGKRKYDEQGNITEKVFYWNEPGWKGMGDLDHSLYVEFYPSGNIKHILLSREEPTGEDNYITRGSYDWTWDKDLNMVEFPDDWSGEFPWKRFNEIKTPQFAK